MRPCAVGVAVDALQPLCMQRAQHARTAARGESQAALVSPAACVMAVAVWCASLKLLYHVTARYLKNDRTLSTSSVGLDHVYSKILVLTLSVPYSCIQE